MLFSCGLCVFQRQQSVAMMTATRAPFLGCGYALCERCIQKTRLKNATRQKKQDNANSDKIEQKEIDCLSKSMWRYE